MRISIRNLKIGVFFIALLFINSITLEGQTDSTRTVGMLINTSDSYNGYTLFSPISKKYSYLIDNEGRLVHQWEGAERPGMSPYLLEDGSILRPAKAGNKRFTAGGTGGRIQIIDWDGNVTWDYNFSNDSLCQHHDIKMMPNGNVIFIAWELKKRDEVLAAGRDPNFLADDELWPDAIFEVKPTGDTTGTIVWEWHSWDHIIQDFDSTKANYGNVKANFGKADINLINDKNHNGQADWNHFNSVDYNEELDQVLISVHNFDEVWIIDHSTTTQEAKGTTGGNSGRGGEILYRWGNPLAYKAGTEADQKLYGQHDAQWIDKGLMGEGNILVFNNGNDRGFSTVEEFQAPMDSSGNYIQPLGGSVFGPSSLVWSYGYDDSTTFFSTNISGEQRLPNGNTLVCAGRPGTFFEISPSKGIVWKYINPITPQKILAQGDSVDGQKISVFKIRRYGADYPGLIGKDLTPGDPIELYPTDVNEEYNSIPMEFALEQNFPNPFNPTTKISFSLPKSGFVSVKVFNLLGQEVANILNQEMNAGNHQIEFSAKNLSSGTYIYQIKYGNSVLSKKMLLLK